MKLLIFIFINLFFIQVNTFCQIPIFSNNFSKKDSIEIPLLDSFSKNYDFVLAYWEQVSPNHNYKVLALKNKNWSCWTYSDNYEQWIKKDTFYKVDIIQKGTFWKVKRMITKEMVNILFNEFYNNNFWRLKNNLLNKEIETKTYLKNGDTIIKVDKGSTDQINYRFELYKKRTCRIVESYSPDYFVIKYKEFNQRRQFINCRDEFLKWWEKYCH